MKKFMLPLLGVFGSVSAFAEGENANAIDTTAVTTGITSWIDALKTTITSWLPMIVGLLGVGVVIALVWIGWKLFRKGGNKVG